MTKVEFRPDEPGIDALMRELASRMADDDMAYTCPVCGETFHPREGRITCPCCGQEFAPQVP